MPSNLKAVSHKFDVGHNNIIVSEEGNIVNSFARESLEIASALLIYIHIKFYIIIFFDPAGLNLMYPSSQKT